MLFPAAASADGAAALGRAYEAYRAGDFAAARATAAPLVHGKLKNHDYALFIAAQSSFLLGDRAAALPLFRQLAAQKGSRFQGLASWRVADCLWELGKPAEARKAYENLLKTDDGDEAVALDRIAQAAAAQDGRAASAAWRRLALEHPAHPLATRAAEHLSDGPLDAEDHLARAQRLTRDRYWQQALDELAEVGNDVAADVAVKRDYWIGTTLFKMRRQYDRAGELLIGVHDKLGDLAAEALFHGARALSRADKDDDAIRWYHEVVKKYPKSDFAAEAQFLSGWLEFNRGRFAAALPDLELLLGRYPRSKFTDDTIWYLGFSHYLLGNYKSALTYLDKLANHGGELEGGKGRYWKARALDALGRQDESTALLRELVGAYPFSWYSMLARARLAERGVSVSPFGDRAAAPSAAPPFGPLEPALAREPLIARADELIAAGMGPEAGVELSRGESNFITRLSPRRALPILMDRYRRAGNYYRPWELAEIYGGAAFRLSPDGSARPWWENAYPRAYRALIEKYEGLGDNPPYYLYSIMRKESGFNPHDVSYADAIGLLQMIPPTTRRVAPQIGLTYTDDLLYDPELNIETGSWYIGHLCQKFKKQIPIAAGSFNSGPRPVMRWLDQFGDRPLDEFVERVAYTQTREYMKKVAGNYARYLYLYERQDYRQPLAVDRDYVKDDLDY